MELLSSPSSSLGIKIAMSCQLCIVHLILNRAYVGPIEEVLLLACEVFAFVKLDLYQ